MGQDEAGAPEHGGETSECANVEVSIWNHVDADEFFRKVADNKGD